MLGPVYTLTQSDQFNAEPCMEGFNASYLSPLIYRRLEWSA